MKLQTLIITLVSFIFVSLAAHNDMISQPFALLLFGLGFIALIRQYKNEENELLTLLFK